jgi:hypothetical protein
MRADGLLRLARNDAGHAYSFSRHDLPEFLIRIHRRPCESRDPYAAAEVVEGNRRSSVVHQQHQWLWLPACAGTTLSLLRRSARPSLLCVFTNSLIEWFDRRRSLLGCCRRTHVTDLVAELCRALTFGAHERVSPTVRIRSRWSHIPREGCGSACACPTTPSRRR